MKTQRILMILVLISIPIFIGCCKPLDITVLQIRPLHGAVISGDLQKIRSEISKGAWLDLKNESGWTALHYAVVKNNPEIINLIIKAGADINLREEKRGQTPLHFAALTGKKEAVEILLKNKANPEIKDVNGKTPKQLAQLTADKKIIDLFH